MGYRPRPASAIGSAVFERLPATWEAVGPTDDFPDDTYVLKVITTRASARSARPPSTSAPTTRRSTASRTPDIPGGGDFIALSTRCMHLGCPVRFVEASERFICPCHGGVYDFTGQVDGGPPVRPLDRFYTRVL